MVTTYWVLDPATLPTLRMKHIPAIFPYFLSIPVKGQFCLCVKCPDYEIMVHCINRCLPTDGVFIEFVLCLQLIILYIQEALGRLSIGVCIPDACTEQDSYILVNNGMAFR